jgi:hypothetical protein
MKSKQGATIIAIFALGFALRGSALAVAHPEDPAKEREHVAMLALAPEGAATHRVFQSGDWSSADTWDDPATPTVIEAPPGDGAKVLIPPGITLTVDGVISARLGWILVAGSLGYNGKLRFAPSVDTELNVETIIVDPNGIYEQGTIADPAQGTVDAPIGPSVKSLVRFIDTGDLDRVYDPFGLSRGLIAHGVTSIHGTAVAPYVFLAEPAMAGETVIHLASEPVNWKLGGRIVVPAVDYVIGFPEGMSQGDLDEQFTIESINFNAGTGNWDVSLNRALAFSHAPPMRDTAPAFSVPVAYLDRNIIYTSESTSTSRRGHAMFMHKAAISISNALFEQLGRTSSQVEVTDPQVDASNRLDTATTGNDRGRYALHIHRTIPDPTKKVKISGVCVVNSPKLGIVNHDSYVDVEDSVVFDAAGSAFFTEIGTELGTFNRCLAIHTIRGVGEMEDRFRHTLPGGADFGFNGVGFWLQGGGVGVTNCMAFNSRREGFVAETVSLTINGVLTKFPASNLENTAWAQLSAVYNAPGYEGFVGIHEVALRKFEGNLTVAAVTGLVTRKHDPIGRPTEIKDFKVFNVSARGIGADYGGPTTFKNVTLQGGTTGYAGAPPWRVGNAWKGITMNASNRGFVFDNVDIRRFEVGLHYVNNWDGLQNYIRNSHFDNILNIEAFVSPFSEAVAHIENTTFSYTTPLLNDPANPRYSAYHDLVLTSFPGRPSSQIWWQPTTGPNAANATLLPFPSSGSISYKLNAKRPPSPPILESFVSRKEHGSAGPIDLYLPITSTAVGVEGRSGGVNDSHRLILTFDRLLAAAPVRITSGNSGVSVTPVIDRNQLILDLEGVADQQWLQFSVAGLIDVYGNVLAEPLSGSEVIPSPNRIVGFFVGDTNADGSVDQSDLSASQVSPGAVDSETFRADVNSDGVVNFLDVAMIAGAAGESAGPSHLLRYALGLDLSSGNGSGFPSPSIEGTDLTLSYTRVLGATDVSSRAVWSNDLASWSTQGIVTEVVSDDGRVQHLKARIPLNGAPKKYMRLEVSAF